MLAGLEEDVGVLGRAAEFALGRNAHAGGDQSMSIIALRRLP
jgi:hypothetical protein